MNEWMNEWIYKYMNEKINECKWIKDICIEGKISGKGDMIAVYVKCEWISKWTNEWKKYMNEWINEWINEGKRVWMKE